MHMYNSTLRLKLYGTLVTYVHNCFTLLINQYQANSSFEHFNSHNIMLHPPFITAVFHLVTNVQLLKRLLQWNEQPWHCHGLIRLVFS